MGFENTLSLEGTLQVGTPSSCLSVQMHSVLAPRRMCSTAFCTGEEEFVPRRRQLD
jgi:hypothetical protein